MLLQIHTHTVSICTKKLSGKKKKKINKDESHASSNHFQCDLVSSQLQTGQIKRSPAALPGDLSLTHQTPFRWPLLTQNMMPDAETSLFSCLECWGSGVGERVWDIVVVGGGKPEMPARVFPCVHKTPALQSIMWFSSDPISVLP